MTNNVAKIAISSLSYHIDKPYSYKIPLELAEKIEIGMRVSVPFGRGNTQKEGIILSLSFEKDIQKLKPISIILDNKPVLDEKMIKLILWMRKRIYCTFFDGVRAALPTGLWFRKSYEYKLLDEQELKLKSAFDEHYLKLYNRFENKETLSDNDFINIFSKESAKIYIDELIGQNIIYKNVKVLNQANDKNIKILSLACPVDEAIRKASRGNLVRLDVVETLSNVSSMSMKELCYMTGATPSIINTMVKNGILNQGTERIYRASWDKQSEHHNDIVLTPSQNDVYEGMANLIDKESAECALLFGITGSGKTHVYLKLIEKVIKQGKGAIMLVPEIALTPQMIAKFTAIFGDEVAVLHSALSLGEKYDQWQRIKEGKASVVVGTRSAIFAPLSNIGIIIIDEEQDGAYRSDSTPKYDARDIAKYRVNQHNCVLVLGSATPSIENYYEAEQGKYHKFELTERFSNNKLPEVIIADMRNAIKEGYGQNFSAILVDEIYKNIQNEEQTILFLNRRGNSRHVKCVTCGYTPECDNCSVALTYHSANDRLMCHYCGFSQKMPTLCPECNSRNLENNIAGTQKIEQDLYGIFGDINVIRMDADTTNTKNSHEKLLKEFSAGKAHILLGTQMVTKGLDFKNVTLVGVLNADLSLYSSDYKSREKTFSLITQVVGRAGRHEKSGRAVIQTYSPDNSVIISGAKQDYKSFYNDEIELRGALLYPPFEDISIFTLTGEREQAVVLAAMNLKQRLQGLVQNSFFDLGATVLGPTAAIVSKVQNKYRYHVTMRAADNTRRRQLISGVISEFQQDKKNSAVSISIDTNPDAI